MELPCRAATEAQKGQTSTELLPRSVFLQVAVWIRREAPERRQIKSNKGNQGLLVLANMFINPT